MKMVKTVSLLMQSLALVCMVAGCATQLVDSRGNPVLSASGNAISISGSAREKIEKYASAICDLVHKELDRLPDAELSKMELSDTQIKAIIGVNSTEDDIAAVRALAEAEARWYLTEVVYPKRIADTKKTIGTTVTKYLAESKFIQANDYLLSIKKTGNPEIDNAISAYVAELSKTKVAPMWATSIISRIRPFLSDRIADGQYEKAREVLWRAPTTENEDVNSKVRVYAIEQMRTVVNPAEWETIKSQIRKHVAELVNEKNSMKL